jgi:hypothetical protein
VESLRVVTAVVWSEGVEGLHDASSVATLEEGVVLPGDLAARMGR